MAMYRVYPDVVLGLFDGSALLRLSGLPLRQGLSGRMALRAHHDEVDDIIAAWTSGYDPIALFHRLQSEGIPTGYLMHEDHVF